MSGNGNFRPAPRKKNALDEYKLRLSCPPTQGAPRPGSFAVSVVKNQPHFDVYTNVPNDKNNGNIRAAMDMLTFDMFMDFAEEVVDLAPNQCYKVQNKNHTWFEGKRSEEPRIVSTTVIGRDKEGVAFIALIAKDRPYLKFNFLPTNYHVVLGLDGQPMPPAEVSTRMLKGWIKAIRDLVHGVAIPEYVEPEKREGGQGGGAGGGQRQGGGGGNWKGGGGQRQGGGGNWKDRQGGGGGGDWGEPAAAGGADTFGGEDDYPM